MQFKKISDKDLEIIKSYVKVQNMRSCDYTVAGIYLWADYYQYEYCIEDGIFFLKGISENGWCDFAFPLGSPDPTEAISQIKRYCIENCIIPRFYFIPEPALEYFPDAQIKKIEGWSDYIYSASEVAELAGKKFHKKKNRLNKFFNAYPDHAFKMLDDENIIKVKDFFEKNYKNQYKDDEHFRAEKKLIDKALEQYQRLGFKGGALYVGDKVAAFTMGEIIGDTLFVHIEKADIQYSGSYEAVNYYFLNHCLDYGIEYINREEDMGDEGLRQAKMAYNPVMFVHKYEVVL